MTLWILNRIKKILKQLNSDNTPENLALGIVMGCLIGMVPFNVLYTIPLVVVLFLFNINVAFAFLSAFFFSVLGISLDMLAHKIGLLLLVDFQFLRPLWTLIMNLPILPFLKLNNTVMLGSLLLAVLLSYPVYLLSKRLIILYRLKWMKKIVGSKLMKLLKASKLFGFIFRYLSS